MRTCFGGSSSAEEQSGPFFLICDGIRASFVLGSVCYSGIQWQGVGTSRLGYKLGRGMCNVDDLQILVDGPFRNLVGAERTPMKAKRGEN
jgi:hypothetical protein